MNVSSKCARDGTRAGNRSKRDRTPGKLAYANSFGWKFANQNMVSINSARAGTPRF